jgi:hypothetical protein
MPWHAIRPQDDMKTVCGKMNGQAKQEQMGKPNRPCCQACLRYIGLAQKRGDQVRGAEFTSR